MVFVAGFPRDSKAEAMLQLFNVSWKEVANKIPELAEAGYDSIWLPPPTKGSGGLSVGYDLWDPFDLGSKDQRGGISTRYGREEDLLLMMRVAHRFGLRVYFDNIMNHRAFDVPGYNESTGIDIYPGMVPEDFHLRKTPDGFYRKWDNTRDWGSGWQVMNLGLADLIDIAHETPNSNHGPSEGDSHPKYSFVRDLERPEQYNIDKNGEASYFGVLIDQAREELGETASSEQLRLRAREYILANKGAFVEDVGAYLIRAARWKIDRTKADGLRLDAVKHVPDYFFGKQAGWDKDSSDLGYLGGIQRQFNLTRGFSDPNHRDSVFEDKIGRDDALVFGEHLGQPPGYGGYWDAGMRLVDNELRSQLNNRLGNPSGTLGGLDVSGGGGFAAGLGITHANSHDSDYAAQKEWQHAYYMTREGIGLIYSDGYNKAETLGESGGAFPRHANTQYLGQFGDPRIPNILKVHGNFARGLQQGLWADADYLAFERRDNRNPDGSIKSGNAAGEVTMVMMMNDNTMQGQARNIWSSFPPNAYLYQYAEGPNGSGMVGFYKYASELGGVTVPPGGYFVFSYRTPEVSNLWTRPLTFFQEGREVPMIPVSRKDGRDGDKNFNPYGLDNRGYPAGGAAESYTYQTTVPVVKKGPVTIVARADGSAENILLKLDGGVNLNNTRLGQDPVFRDNPPGLRTDIFLGYEQPLFLGRQHPEKFAAVEVSRNKIGSEGSETYVKTTDGRFTTNAGPSGGNNWNTFDGNVAQWVYHDPEQIVGGPQGVSGVGDAQFGESGGNIVLWAKSNAVGLGFKGFVYYTTDGTYPEGAGGVGRGTTKVAELFYRHNQGSDNWWKSVEIPRAVGDGEFIYKIGFYKNAEAAWWPADESSVSYKKQMLTTFQIDEFNPAEVEFFPHNDYERVPEAGKPYDQWAFATQTGLDEGFHVIRGRAFLRRGSGEAPLFNTFTQVFYYDAVTPTGEIRFPSRNEIIGGSSYEVVVRTDPTVEELWYHVADGDGGNDDSVTRQLNGNGIGFEPFVDADGSRTHTPGETFIDINDNGVYDTSLAEGWGKAVEVPPSRGGSSPYQKEWRFRYNNIPASGSGLIKIRLLEASSSRNLTKSAEEAHVTELTTSVQTRGPEGRVNIAWPQEDGVRVDDNYTMKVHFSKGLADGLSTEELKQRFTFSISSQSSGDDGGAVIQPRGGYQVNYNVSEQFHELAIPLPNLYNDVADFLHTLKVVYRFPDGRTRDAERLVLANPSTRPFVRITRPTEVESDGRTTEIILRDGVGEDVLEYVIQVESSSGLTEAPVIAGIDGVEWTGEQLNGSIKTWSYKWTIEAPGNYAISASAILNGQRTSTTRNVRVVLRQIVDPSGNETEDDDDDGLINIHETSRKALPTSNPETWSNAEVHLHFATGKSFPTSPDSDGDGLPDALEVGWRVAASPPTDTSVDANGDGFPNFIGDLDPPLYAVVENHGFVPGVGSQSAGDDRTRLAEGTVTDPLNPDSDGDGLLDGVEDGNRDGWTDGDGKPLPLEAGRQQYSTHRPNIGDWPNDSVDSFETWGETSPTKTDSDGDELSDGYGEDVNLNGRTDLYLKDEAGELVELLLSDHPQFYARGGSGRGVDYEKLLSHYSPDGRGTAQVNGWPAIVISETDPLVADTDRDGLPDGWETKYGLDPLDNGDYSFRKGGGGEVVNGPEGDADGDGISNSIELTNGTRPDQRDETGGGQASGVISIGKFTDWTHEDLLVLDEYNEGGSQGADVYRTNAFDNSRDIVSFSFRDGGSRENGGDGRIYFRIDFMDLSPNAWEGEVDAYIMIDSGNPSVGERAVPDHIDIATDMRWEAAVAVYGQNSGVIYVDTNRAVNTTDQFQDPLGYGVARRGFGGVDEAAWSGEFDAVEVAIERQHLIDAGWRGDPRSLNFQVFTTKPGTFLGGAGDLPGRNDIRDTVYDDWVVSDHWRDFDNVSLNGRLAGYFGKNSSNDIGRGAKVILLAHGNQAIERGDLVQDMVNNRDPRGGSGYSRLLDTHEYYRAPLTLHITPTLAVGLEWAKSTNDANDGILFNSRIRRLVKSGGVDILGSTYSDHILKYFPEDFNESSKNLAQRTLDQIYGEGYASTSRDAFWAAERVLDTETLRLISAMGYGYTFADQSRHFSKWFGRLAALGDDGYRLNRVNGVNLFPIHDLASHYLEQSLDGGTALPLRQLLSRRSRSGVQDQIVVLWKDLLEFRNRESAATYDLNVKWMATRPWIRIVTPAEIIGEKVPHRGSDGVLRTTWGFVDRGVDKRLVQTAKDWVDYATQENYDNWYNGSSYEEGLRNQTFNTLFKFGQVGIDGVVNDAWRAVQGLRSASLKNLAESVIHSSVFQTAFHDTPFVDLSKYSTGDYVNPDSGVGQKMTDFARISQAQARYANVYRIVDEWAATARATTMGTRAADVDLDGGNECLIFNSRIFAILEPKGGRIVGAWMRSPVSKKVWQVAGNFSSFSGTEAEDEGEDNRTARRTSLFKDWHIVPSGGGGGVSLVNADYVVSSSETGWTFTGDLLSKTISLRSPTSTDIVANYRLGGAEKVYIRFGLSPNLEDLIMHGQKNLPDEISTSSSVELVNVAEGEEVRSYLSVGEGGSVNSSATDRLAGGTTVQRRNQAQTHQVEVELLGGGERTIVLTFDNGGVESNPDADGDGLQDDWENSNFGDLDQIGEGDPDGDGLSNRFEERLGTDPNSISSGWPRLSLEGLTDQGFVVRFPTAFGLNYRLKSKDDLTKPGWSDVTGIISGDGAIRTVIDHGAIGKSKRFYTLEILFP